MRGAVAATSDSAEEAMRLDPAFIYAKLEAWVIGFQRLLPNIAVAIVVLLPFFFAAWIARRSFNAWASRHDRNNLDEVLGSFIRWVIIAFGLLIALTIVVPSLRPGDLVAGLGIGSAAIGFAFKDILQNWLAGVLLLLRQPFRLGNQIVVRGYEVTVGRIATRATIIKTYDGRRVLVPNADVYSDAVIVNTAHDKRRSEFDVGIGYGDSIDIARATILKSLADVQGIESEPTPEVLVWELAAYSVNLRVRWWTSSTRADVVHVRAAALEAIKKALDGAGIDMPFETQVMLWHDQTEELDGRRGKQREGWPKLANGSRPKAARERAAQKTSDSSEIEAGRESQ